MKHIKYIGNIDDAISMRYYLDSVRLLIDNLKKTLEQI